MRRWLRVITAELPLLRDLPDFSQRPLPRVEVELGPSLPGWLLRLAAVLATASMVTVATGRTGMVAGLAGALIGSAAIMMATLPSAAVAHTAVVASGLFVAVGGHGPFDPVVFGLIPLGYLSVRLGWWAERATLTARVELAALAGGWRQWLAVVGGTLGLAGVVFVVAGHPSPIAVIVGGVALVALTWLVAVPSR